MPGAVGPTSRAPEARQYPMMVLTIEDALKLNEIPKHEDIQEKLVEWTPGMADVVFFSHTWLGFTHPDPKGVKWLLLKQLLQKALEGVLDVHPHWSVEFLFDSSLRLKAKKLQAALTGGYIWIDFASVPQFDKDAQRRAIASLSTYVADSAYFVCLAGPWKHADDGSIRDVRAWNNRGWCRLEGVANALAATGKRALIVAESTSSVVTYGSFGMTAHGWMIDQVASKGAQFTYDADREVVGPVIQQMIEGRKAAALERLADSYDELVWYRMLHCRTSYMLEGTGVSTPREALDDWLAAMRFSSPTEDEQTTGYSPLLFAVLGDRVDLASQLLDLGADLNVRLKGRNRVEFWISKNPAEKGCIGADLFMVQSYLCDNPEMVQLLVSRGATIRRNVPASYLDNACIYGRPGNLDALLALDPTLVDMCSDMAGMNVDYPLSYILFAGQQATYQHMLTRYPDVMKRYLERGTAGPTSGLSTAAICCMGPGQNVDILKWIIESGVDVNWVGTTADRTSVQRFVIPMIDLMLRLTRGTPSHMMQYFGYAGPRGASPLHMACFSGNLGAVEVLLGAGADVHSRKHAHRMTPLHLAAMGGHKAIVEALLKVGARAAVRVKGNTPATWAKRRGHAELAEQLRARIKEERQSAGGPGGRKYEVKVAPEPPPLEDKQ